MYPEKQKSLCLMPRTRKDCPLCGKKSLCKLSNHLADTHQLSSEERRVYLKSSCADEEDHDNMPRSKRPRIDNFDEGTTSSDYHNSDIFDNDEEEEKEYSSEEEENRSEENENSEEDDSKEESEDGDDESSEDEEDYDPWQRLIHEAKLPLLDEFQENVEYFENEGLSKLQAKRRSFSTLLPKLTKELEGVYLDRLQWMSQMKKDRVHKKITETRKRFVEDDSFDPEEATVAAIKKRKFLLQRILADRQHFHENDDN